MELRHKHKDVVDVDFYLPDQVDISALVVLEIAVGQDFIARKIVEGSQDIFKSQDCSEQSDIVLLVLFSDDRLSQRECLSQLLDLFHHSNQTLQINTASAVGTSVISPSLFSKPIIFIFFTFYMYL